MSWEKKDGGDVLPPGGRRGGDSGWPQGKVWRWWRWWRHSANWEKGVVVGGGG